nr:MAG TPA: hypothetical protein [Caudoviricetes sp.]
MTKVDIEELKELNYEQGAELLTAAGYAESDGATADASDIADFVRDNYWKLYDEGGETIDTVSWVEYFNILKHNAGDLDDEEIIRAGWERMEYVE